MINLDSTKPLRIIGDVHYSYNRLLPLLSTFESSNLVFLGDLGGELDFYTKLAGYGHHVYCIRGNHDDPEIFQESEINRYFQSRGVRFLSEVAFLSYQSVRILTIGGAVSIDRAICYERRNTNVSQQALKAIDQGVRADLMLSHTPPTNGYKGDYTTGFIAEFAQDDFDLIEDVIEEQRTLQSVMDRVGAKTAIFGHLHTSYEQSDDVGRLYRCLDIGEVMAFNP